MNEKTPLQRLHETLATSGISGLARAAARRLRRPQFLCRPSYRARFRSTRGLEIGGPSPLFGTGGLVPIYGLASRIDNCNFAATTAWGESREEGDGYRFSPSRPPGRQYIMEAGDLSRIPSATYGYVLASHCIEHLANPLGALEQWIRVLEVHGLLVLVVPHRDGTFDHRRPVTALEHLEEDRDRKTGEDDMTHLEEILRLHDLSRDPEAGDFDTFRARCVRNLDNRCLHHHVFDTRLVAEMLHAAGLKILAVEPLLPRHIVALAQKPPAGERVDNVRFRASSSRSFQRSPFPSDHH